MKFSPYFFLLIFLLLACNQELSSDQIISKSIDFHDPMKEWSTLQHQLIFEEYRPDGVVRNTIAAFDLPNETYKIYRQNQYAYEITKGTVAIDSGDITTERALTIKDYYLYLWGLPMKLKDPSTTVGQWTKSKWAGEESLEVPVFYEKDTWYFHFDPLSFEMIGYKFYSDSARTKGETILLDHLADVSKMKLPMQRSWYTIPENKYLGKDVLVDSKKLK